MYYPVILHKDSDSDYGVSVPDIPGCFSAGATYDEALINAQEAIECHLEGLLFDGETIPLPTEMSEHLEKAEYKEGVWALVAVDLCQISGKARRVNITLPERILFLIDLYAKHHSMKNRSALIAEATLSYIAAMGVTNTGFQKAKKQI